jgi:hypothetical protein
VCQELSVRPLTLWDAEYGCAPFVLATADIPADKIMRLRPNLCLWGPPPPYRGNPPYGGQPPIRGATPHTGGNPPYGGQGASPQAWGQVQAK